LSIPGVFIAWRRLSRRTEDLSRELGLELVFIPDKPPYIRAALKTASILRRRKLKVVFVQLPQGPLLGEVVALSKFLGFSVVADVHTGFIFTTTLKERMLNSPFHRYLRSACLILVHNILEQDLIAEKTGAPKDKTIVVYDPVPAPPQRLKEPKLGIELDKAVVLPASWSPDEPIDRVAEEFLKSRALKEFTLVITGNWRRNESMYSRVVEVMRKYSAEDKVIVTGFVPDEEYWYVLKSCRAIIVLTSREYTLPHTLWEAVATRKLFLVSRTRTLETEIGSGYPCLFSQDLRDFGEAMDRCLLGESQTNAEKVAEMLEARSRQSIENLRRAIQTLL
jgi:glycosyltransferase involved in cell wall biosynthesis